MIKRIATVVFVLTLIALLSSPVASAQNANPCLQISTWWFPDPIPFGYFYYGPYPAPLVYLIAAYSSTCSPPPECPCAQAAAGKPINLATGDTYIEQQDVTLPGLGGGLQLKRKWNSLWPADQVATSVGIFGSHWKSTYEERIFIDSNQWVRYAKSDGSYVPMAVDPIRTDFHTMGPGIDDWLVPDPTSLTLKFGSGEKRVFDLKTGLLTSIVDRNGNTTAVAWDSSGRLTTVTDPASRHLYFNYPTGSNLVSSVTSDFGVTVSYTYDSQNRLSQVTRPDLTTINFVYDSQSNITSVTDQNGRVLESHTYDSGGRGLTSSQANGVNSLSITYP